MPRTQTQASQEWREQPGYPGAFIDQFSIPCSCEACQHVRGRLGWGNGLMEVAQTIANEIGASLSLFGANIGACPTCRRLHPDRPGRPTCCNSCYECCTCIECGVCHQRSRTVRLCETCHTCVLTPGRLTHCCNCIECRECNTRNPNVRLCQNCNQCTAGSDDSETCCSCAECRVCHARFYEDDFCFECDRCQEHCADRYDYGEDDDPAFSGNRREGRVPRFQADRQPFYEVKQRADRKLNPSTRLVAVEIEVAGIEGDNGMEIGDVCRRWGCNIVGDGSLPASGFEINTAPAAGDHWLREIDDICKALNNQRAGVTESCGLHCHIDCRDFKYYDMRRLLFLYAKIEKGLFKLVPPVRRRSTYCEPCGEKLVAGLLANRLPKVAKDTIVENLYGRKDTRPFRRDRHNGVRYKAWNVHSWFYRGTIECRLFNGTTNATKIKNWGMLMVGLCDTAYKMTEKQIQALKGDSIEDQIAIIQQCAPTQGVAEWVAQRYKRWGKVRDDRR